MKKFIKKEMQVEVCVCDICGEEITNLYEEKRIEIVKHLFNTSKFDAHEKCVNDVTRNAFAKYFENKNEN